MESKHKQLTILRCKLLVVGDACVGKTALVQVFQSNGATYPKNYIITVGVDFSVKQIPIENTNIVVELYIHDCAGQSIFNQLDMSAKYYENSAAVMLVYDIGNHESLSSISKWFSAVKTAQASSSGNSNTELIAVLVGNKCDFREESLDSRAEVSRESGQAYAKDLDRLTYFETSAAANTGITDPFTFIANEFYRRYEESLSKGGSVYNIKN